MNPLFLLAGIFFAGGVLTEMNKDAKNPSTQLAKGGSDADQPDDAIHVNSGGDNNGDSGGSVEEKPSDLTGDADKADPPPTED